MNRKIAISTPNLPGNHHGLMCKAVITLHSRQAAVLVKGRRANSDKPPITGLIDCARKTQVIWGQARKGDPYADWWLIQVADAIKGVDKHLEDELREYKAVLAKDAAFHRVETATAEDPTSVDLSFGNTYSFLYARLLADFDRLACTVITAERIGLLEVGSRHEILNKAASKIRGVFQIPGRYRVLEIYRNSTSAAEKLEEAKHFMGEVPEDILTGERRPEHLQAFNTNGS